MAEKTKRNRKEGDEKVERAKRVVSGSRPSGKLHLGHLHGTLTHWIELQENYDCFYFVADWHALTTAYDDVSRLKKDTLDMVIDWIAIGLDPSKCTIYRQSDSPNVAELALYFSLITPLSWLERNPTYKEQLKEIKGRDISTHGFLGYPVLQTADIVLYSGELVPIGEDQLPHLELAREIVRRFNYLYGETFSEPQPLLAPVTKLLGTDGRKMSKSYNNAIYLTDSPQVIKEKVRMMITDPARVRRKDPGHPEVCTVFDLHKIYTKEDLEDIESKCRGALRGCIECKDIVAEKIALSLKDFQARRKKYEENPGQVMEVLEKGAQKVRPIAQGTLQEVKRRMNLSLI